MITYLLLDTNNNHKSSGMYDVLCIFEYWNARMKWVPHIFDKSKTIERIDGLSLVKVQPIATFWGHTDKKTQKTLEVSEEWRTFAAANQDRSVAQLVQSASVTLKRSSVRARSFLQAIMQMDLLLRQVRLFL